MTDAVWKQIDVTTLSAKVQAAYAELKAAQAVAKIAREAFEARLSEEAGALPQGKRLAFGYKFGKLSIAVVADDKKAKPQAVPLTLAQTLKGLI